MAMGIKHAIRVEEAGADMNDSLVWSALAAGAIDRLGEVDLVICGKEAWTSLPISILISWRGVSAGPCSATSLPYWPSIMRRALSK